MKILNLGRKIKGDGKGKKKTGEEGRNTQGVSTKGGEERPGNRRKKVTETDPR